MSNWYLSRLRYIYLFIDLYMSIMRELKQYIIVAIVGNCHIEINKVVMLKYTMIILHIAVSN